MSIISLSNNALVEN